MCSKLKMWTLECEHWNVSVEMWAIKCEQWNVIKRAKLWALKCERWNMEDGPQVHAWSFNHFRGAFISMSLVEGLKIQIHVCGTYFLSVWLTQLIGFGSVWTFSRQRWNMSAEMGALRYNIMSAEFRALNCERWIASNQKRALKCDQ